MKIFWELFITFFRIGAFTFGGGYAMLPIIQREIVETKKWATDEEVIDYYAIGQSTPGIIAINTATFIGYKVKGLMGGIIATTGMVTPSLIIIISIFSFLNQFQNSLIVKSAFGGIRACVVALLINSIYTMGKKSIVDWKGILIAVVAFLFIVVTKFSPIWVVIISALSGIIIKAREVSNS